MRYFDVRPLVMVCTLAAVHEPAKAADTLYDFVLPAAPLANTLIRIGQQSGRQVLFIPADVENRRSTPVAGRFSASQAIERALEGSGLVLRITGDGSLKVQPAPRSHDESMELSLITVDANAQRDGSAAAGYVTEQISQAGPWQGRSLLDTPYSINVVSAEQIKNVQAISLDQVFKMNPVVQSVMQQRQNDQPRITLRGFGGSSESNLGRDGIPRVSGVYAQGVNLEDVEQIEVLTGVSGFLYGPGHVGGLVNYVTKRPTAERFSEINVGNESAFNVRYHGDFGGPIDDEGIFGYRINVAHQEGETQTKGSYVDRDFVSAAFDWHIRPNLLLQVEGMRQHYDGHGGINSWYFYPGYEIPSAKQFDPDDRQGQKWSYYKVESERMSARLRWEANDWLTIRTGISREEFDRRRLNTTKSVNSNDGYSLTWNYVIPGTTKMLGSYAYADLSFNTGPIQHKLTGGFLQSAYDQTSRTASGARSGTLESGLTFRSGTAAYDRPTVASVGGEYKAAEERHTSWMIGDDIVFNEKWSMLLGFNHATIITNGWASSHERNAHYNKSKTTPTVSLIYKPVDWITTYISHMEALESGGTAAETYSGGLVTNAYQTMNPMVSRQMEAGIKADVGGMLLTAAVFEIDKALSYYVNNGDGTFTYQQDGRQVHEGIELTATGKATPNLTLVGGATFLDARVEDQKANPSLEGNRPVYVAERNFKLYGEYALNSMLPGMSVNAGAYYTGDSYYDSANTQKISSYTIYDVGARYEFKAQDYSMTLRANVYNLGDKRYWTSGGSLGDPRTLMLSTSVEF
ncbi:TonB-dependent siderophore receptor [Azotobacter vinelandii]